MRAFTERMGASFKDAGLDSDPTTAEYGREEEKVTLYDNGVPEMIGRKTVEKLFEGQPKIIIFVMELLFFFANCLLSTTPRKLRPNRAHLILLILSKPLIAGADKGF